MAMSPEEQEQLLLGTGEMIAGELANIATAKQGAAMQQIQENEAALVGQRKNKTIDDALSAFIGPNEFEVIRVAPGDTVIKTWGNTRTVKDPKSGHSVVVGENPAYTAAQLAAPMNPGQIVQNQFNNAQEPKSQLNIQSELSRLRQLSGDELFDAISNLTVNIHSAIAQEQQTIRKAAELQSGLTEAKTAYDMNIELDRQKGGVFATQASHQTLQAGTLFTQALARSEALAQSLTASSSRMGELSGALKTLTSLEAHRARSMVAHENKLAAQRERAAQQGERALQMFELRNAFTLARDQIQNAFSLEKQAKSFEERAAIVARKAGILRSAVSDEMLLNYQLTYGTTGDAEKDREAIITRAPKNEMMQKILMADKTSLFEMLSSSNSEESAKALQLIDRKDKLLNNPNADIKTLDSLPQSSTAKMLQDVLSRSYSPQSMIAMAKELNIYGMGEEARTRTTELQNTLLFNTDKATKERVRLQVMQDIINAQLAISAQKRLTEDVRTWKTSETAGIFKEALAGARSKDGKVSLELFVDSVMNTEIKRPDGTVLDKDQKKELLRNTILTAAKTQEQSMLFPATNLLAEKVINQAMGRASVSLLSSFFGGASAALQQSGLRPVGGIVY